MRSARAKRVSVVAVVSLGIVACAEGVEPAAHDGDSGAGTGGAGAVGGSGGAGAFGATGGTSTGGSASGGTSGGAGSGTGGGAGSGTGGSAGTGGSGAGGAGGSGTGGTGGTVDAGPPPPPPIDDLELRYKEPTGNPTDNEFKAHFEIVNTGSDSIPVSELVVRYWYTIDNGGTASTQTCGIDYAQIGNGNADPQVHDMSSPEITADAYVEVTLSGSTVLSSSSPSSGEIQIRCNWVGYTNTYDETNDYSWDGTKTSLAAWGNVTLYRNGYLVWGREPDGTVPTAPGADGGADGGASDAAAGDAGGASDAGAGDAATD